VHQQAGEASVDESRGLSGGCVVERVSLPDKVQQEMLSRLRRIEGQARGVQRMVENQRDCTEIISQLASIRAATYSASLLLLKHYARACWADASGDRSVEGTLDNLIELMLRLS